MNEAYTIKEMPADHKYPEMSYGNHGEGGKAIYQGASLIAYVWIHLTEHESTKGVKRTMEMEMIEVIEKEQGHGTAIIKFLFRHFNLESMNGHVLFEDNMRPYYFWSSLGAEMQADNEAEYWEMYEDGIDIYFDLHRNQVMKGIPLEVGA